MTPVLTSFQCDSCCHAVDGYSRKDLLEMGWNFHDIGGDRHFLMCVDCEREYATRRLANAVA